LTFVFKESLKLEGLGVGLPFFVAASLLAVVAVVVFSAIPPRLTPQQTPDSSRCSALEDDSSINSTVQPSTPVESPKSPVNNGMIIPEGLGEI
jgi:hypothetical protein